MDYIDKKIEEYEKDSNESGTKDKEFIKMKITTHLARKKKI